MSLRHLAGPIVATTLVASALAGPLTPPGAPTPTMKTLDEIRPSIPVSAAATPGDTDAVFVIAQPGVYHLTADVVGEAGKHGIQILASDVTLDLGGFRVLGGAGTLSGIRAGEDAGPNLQRIRVRNGAVSNWGVTGVQLAQATWSSIDDVAATESLAYGVWIGPEGAVTNALCDGNALDGLRAEAGAHVLRSRSGNNGDSGFNFIGSGFAQDCEAFSNGEYGFIGSRIRVENSRTRENNFSGYYALEGAFVGCSSEFDGGGIGTGSLAEDCIISQPQAQGIDVDVARGCTVVGVGTVGINARRIIDCTVAGFPTNISIDASGLVMNSTISSGGNGIFANTFEQVTIENVTISNLTGTGIIAPGANTVVRGVTINNVGNRGIEAGTSAVIDDVSIFDAGAVGVVVGDGATISRLSVRQTGGAGVAAANSATIIDSVFEQIGTTGIIAGFTANIERCTVRTAGVDGITVAAASRVAHSVINSTLQHGIVTTDLARIEHNLVDFCGRGTGVTGAAVKLGGTSNRVEGNSLMRTDYGVEAFAAGNVVISNTFSGNLVNNINLVAGNVLAPILNSTTITTTPHPQANFTH